MIREKFYVWGAGKRGGDIVNALGVDRVIAFIEGNTSKVESVYRDRPIISFETFTSQYNGEYIIITPDGYEDEIENLLLSKNIKHFFKYGDDFLDVETYMIQVDKNVLFADVDLCKSQYVYGFSLLGLMLYEDLCELGADCYFVLQPSFDLEKIADKFPIADISKADFLHLAMPLGTESYNCGYANYYSLIDDYDFHNEELEKFGDKHKGDRCFIVATGPSLRIEDLDMLHKHDEICISMNGIHKAFDMTQWRPDYYMIADPNAMYFNKDTFKNINVKYKFAADIIGDIGTIDDNIYRWHIKRRWEIGVAPKFSGDFSRVAYAGLSVTYDGALQLAVFMGFSEIYMLGVDCSNYRNTGTSHFFDRYGKENKEETRLLDVDQNILAFKSAKEYADSHGIKIYNATRGGKLEVFERVDFDSLFK